ncbi:GNAT family N-acetyltransferase [Undibacterium sp. RuTC16W]|uniref:GNAT family N-acetyltransferase n=1 Tax=Undibacterium sp. RuTC16W TaxID=3413048 RepID=UPI003BF23BDA
MHISTDQSLLDIPLIHDFLSQHTAWAKDIPRAIVERSLTHSLCFGGYLGSQQIAFARVISDYATYAYLMDVFVLPGYRGQGHSKQLVRVIMAHPDLQGLRRFMLASSDARGLYEKFGFKAPAKPETLMEINRPGMYQKTS